MDKLIGRTIAAIRCNADRTALCFDTDAGPVAFEVEGDCCSSSWFEHVEGTEALLGQTVTGVAEREQYDDEADKRDECVTVYGFVLTTAAGRAAVEFRNASNGYYGGWCSHRPAAAEQCTTPITGDF